MTAPTNWLSNAMQAVEDILVASSSFRALMGTGSDTSPWPATRALVVWQDSRGQGQSAPCCLIVMQPGEASEPEATKVTRHDDAIDAYIVWPINDTGGSTDKDFAIIAMNAFGALLADIAATLGTPNPLGTASYLTKATRRYEPPTRTPDDGSRPNCWDGCITFSWSI